MWFTLRFMPKDKEIYILKKNLSILRYKQRSVFYQGIWHVVLFPSWPSSSGQTRVMVLWRSSESNILFSKPEPLLHGGMPCQHSQISLSTWPNQITRFHFFGFVFCKIYLVLIFQLQTSRHRKAQITWTLNTADPTQPRLCACTQSQEQIRPAPGWIWESNPPVAPLVLIRLVWKVTSTAPIETGHLIHWTDNVASPCQPRAPLPSLQCVPPRINTLWVHDERSQPQPVLQSSG